MTGKQSVSFGLSCHAKKPSFPKGTEGFGGTTLISVRFAYTLLLSVNAGSALCFHRELRGRFHCSRTEPSHQPAPLFGLLPVYYSHHRHNLLFCCLSHKIFHFRSSAALRFISHSIGKKQGCQEATPDSARVIYHLVLFLYTWRLISLPVGVYL